MQFNVSKITKKEEEDYTDRSKFYYKYLSLNKFKYIEDILSNNRLYAAKLSQLNDPWEGFFLKPYESSYNITTDLYQNDNYGICCLTKDIDNHLMWAHYGDSFRGIVIAVKINEEKYKIHDINYNGFRDTREIDTLTEDEIISVLTQKQDCWKYEKEKRIIEPNSHYIDVEVVEIYFGYKIDSTKKEALQKLIKKFNPAIKTIDHKPTIKFAMNF